MRRSRPERWPLIRIVHTVGYSRQRHRTVRRIGADWDARLAAHLEPGDPADTVNQGDPRDSTGCVKLFVILYADPMTFPAELETPKGYRHPAVVIKYAMYLYHRFSLSYRDVQELLFERGIALTHETVRACLGQNGTRMGPARWCIRFGPDIAEQLRSRASRCARTWHADEMRLVIGGVVHWLWRAVNERGEVLEILLRAQRDTEAAERFFQRLLDRHEVPDVIVTDKLGSYGAALRDPSQLGGVVHGCVRASARVNNRVEQSHRATWDQERSQRGFRCLRRAQSFLVAHVGFSNAFRRSRGRARAGLGRATLAEGFEALGGTVLRLA